VPIFVQIAVCQSVTGLLELAMYLYVYVQMASRAISTCLLGCLGLLCNVVYVKMAQKAVWACNVPVVYV
jgi:hypothetical protein